MTNRRIIPRLHHLSNTFWSTTTRYPSYGLDQFSTDLSRRRYLHPSRRNSACHDPLHRRCSDQRPKQSISTPRWIIRNDSTKSQHSTIRVGTLSKSQSHRSANEVLWRHIFWPQGLPLRT